ncbi:MAG TPA: hypothetical protein VGG35_16530 [Streptosporangiaceae bacterium]
MSGAVNPASPGFGFSFSTWAGAAGDLVRRARNGPGPAAAISRS